MYAFHAFWDENNCGYILPVRKKNYLFIYFGVVMLHASFTCTILVSDKVGFCSVLIQSEYICLALYFQISHHFCCLHAFGWNIWCENFRCKSSGVLGERHYCELCFLYFQHCMCVYKYMCVWLCVCVYVLRHFLLVHL